MRGSGRFNPGKGGGGWTAY